MVIQDSKFRDKWFGCWKTILEKIGSPPDNLYHANRCSMHSMAGRWETNRCSTELKYIYIYTNHARLRVIGHNTVPEAKNSPGYDTTYIS